MIDFGRWTFSKYTYRNGCKTIGGAIWWNDSRVSVEVSLGLWQFMVMRERKWK